MALAVSLTPAPLVVVESVPAQAAALAEVTGAGWVVVTPEPHAGEVWNLSVDDAPTAAGAVLAAVRGCGLVAIAHREVAVGLAEDLRGLGNVHYRDDSGPVLDAPSWALLHAMARGHTVQAAARMAHLSVRTAERRLAAAQRELRASSLAAAVAQLNSSQRISSAPL